MTSFTVKHSPMDKFKIACYLDEAGEEPADSCKTLNRHNIHYAVLRHSWGTQNICESNDSACKRLKSIVDDHNISVVSISTDLGRCPATHLTAITDASINHAFDIAKYYNAESIKFTAGTKVNGDARSIIDDWMSRISEISIKNNILPILEIIDGSHIIDPDEIISLLVAHKRWRLLYDPVQLIIKRKIDPFIRYWSLMKNKTYAIDVRDYVVGKGFRPPGLGDARMKETLHDATQSGYNGWLFLEPNLGRRYSSALTKSQTFDIVIESLEYLF